MRKGRLIELLSKYQSDMVEVYKQPIVIEEKVYVGVGCTGDYPSKTIDVKYWDEVVKADELRGE